MIRKTLESGEPQNVEYDMKIGDEEKWRFATATQLTENSVLWVARDITELKLKQKEITESERKYRELVENSLVGVFKVNLSGHITYANKSMAEMLEYSSPKELMSVNSLDLYVSDEDREELIGELRKNRKTEKNKEVKFITRSGKVKNVLISASLGWNGHICHGEGHNRYESSRAAIYTDTKAGRTGQYRRRNSTRFQQPAWSYHRIFGSTDTIQI